MYRRNWEFVNAVIQCSPSRLDAAISLRSDLINSALKYPQHITSQRHEIVVDRLIRHVTKNFQTDTLVHEVARRGNLNQLARLLKNKSASEVERIFQQKDERGKTPLMWACLSNSVDVVKFLLSSGANLYSRDSFGQTGFLQAC